MILCLFVSCTVTSDFHQEVVFSLAESSTSFTTNITVYLTDDDIRNYLKKAGYPADDFESMVINSAILQIKNNSENFEWLNSFTLTAATEQDQTVLYNNDNNMGSTGQQYDLQIDAEKLLPYYKSAPFSLTAGFSGNAVSALDILLIIDGTMKIKAF